MDIHTLVLSTKKPPVFGIDNQLFGDSQEKKILVHFFKKLSTLRHLYEAQCNVFITTIW